MPKPRKPDPLLWVRDQYKVPAFKGARVRYSGGEKPREGEIIGMLGPHISVVFDGETRSTPLHPTWQLEYLPVK